MAQKKRSSGKSLSLILPFTKKIADQIRHLRGAFEHSLVLGGGNLKEIISKVQMSGGILELIDA